MNVFPSGFGEGVPITVPWPIVECDIVNGVIREKMRDPIARLIRKTNEGEPSFCGLLVVYNPAILLCGNGLEF